MTLLQRCKFVLHAKDKFSELSNVLFGYNDGLLKVCRPPVVQVGGIPVLATQQLYGGPHL
jgi:hypothetical protein